MSAATHVSPVRRDRFIWLLISSLIAVVALGATASTATATGAAEKTSPAVVQDPSTGVQTVYYVNEKQEIAYWTNGAGWKQGVLGGKVASGTSPTAMAIGSNQYVYYVNTSGEIATWALSAGKWIGPTTLGGKVASGTSPTVIHDANNYQYVYYVNSKNEVSYWAFTTEWIGPLTIGGAVAKNSNLTATRTWLISVHLLCQLIRRIH